MLKNLYSHITLTQEAENIPTILWHSSVYPVKSRYLSLWLKLFVCESPVTQVGLQFCVAKKDLELPILPSPLS